ncbi:MULTISPECIES: cell division protein SepF [unclassified Gordonia (in: high G+C Gram-positive bacteria)]
MTTMQKFKAYFGMVPPSEYEDDYFDEPGPGPIRPPSRERAYRDDYYGGAPIREGYDDPYGELAYRDAPEAAYDDRRFGPGFDSAPGYEQGYQGDYTYNGARHAAEVAERVRPVSRLEPLQRSSGATLRAAGAMAPAATAELERVFADGPLHKITTLRPGDYSEARTIGERFRDGNPVIMDLVDMSNDDAKRLVDFAAGLAFALRGSFDKVATKVFLLSPADIDVSPEDRRKIAATGFYNHD